MTLVLLTIGVYISVLKCACGDGVNLCVSVPSVCIRVLSFFDGSVIMCVVVAKGLQKLEIFYGLKVIILK